MQSAKGNNEQHESHILLFDYLRGIAILGVLLQHTYGVYFVVNFFTDAPLLFLDITIAGLAAFAVPLFICVSGFVLYRSSAKTTSWTSFYRSRLSRVVPAYIFFSLLYSSISGETSPLTILFQLVTGGAHFHLWFVPLIIQLYLLFPLLAKLASYFSPKKKSFAVLGIAVLSQIVWGIISLILPASASAHMSTVFLSHIFYFVLGMYMAIHFEIISQKIRTFPLTWITLGLLPLLFFLSTLTLLNIETLLRQGAFSPTIQIVQTLVVPFYIVLAILFCVRLLITTPPKEYILKFLKLMGANAYGIYLIHGAYLILFEYILNFLHFSKISPLFNPVLLMLILAASYLSIRILAAIPYIRILAGAPPGNYLHAEKRVS